MNNPAPKLSPVTTAHFAAFGAIVHMFARHEMLMVGIIAQIIKSNTGTAAMLMAEMPYRGKRDTVLAMVIEHFPQHYEKVAGYLG